MLWAAPAAMADVDFEATPVGASSPWEDIVVENLDSEPLVLSPAAIVGPDAATFGIVADDCDDAPLESGELCVVTLDFEPQRLGQHAATLEIEIDGDPEPLSLALSGEGIPWLSITPSVLDFGTLAFGAQGGPLEAVVQNVSGRGIGLLDARIAGSPTSFRVQSDGCQTATAGDATLPPGATCRVTVTFRAGTPLGAVTEDRLSFINGVNQALTAFTEIGSLPLRGATEARAQVLESDESGDTADVSGQLGRRLRAAMARLRSGGPIRAALLRRGLVVRGIQPPAEGLLTLVVRARRSKGSPAALLAVRRRHPAEAGERVAIRARLTRAGRRLLRSGRPLVLDVELTLVARLDKLVSSADGVLRVPRARS
jgi:hypothetical protein